MPLKLKQKQITVQVGELTLELDQALTTLLTDAAEAEGVEPDAYVLALLHQHLSLSPETAQSAFGKTATGKPAANKSVVPLPAKPSPERTATLSTNTTKARSPERLPDRGPKASRPKYLGKLSDLVAFGDEGNDIALELKNQGLISSDQYEAVLNGEVPKGKAAAIDQDAQNYIVEQLTKADAGSSQGVGEDSANSVNTANTAVSNG